MSKLQDTVVLITGAAGGFGQEMARQFLQAGSRVVLTDLDKGALEALVVEIRQTIHTGKVLGCIAGDLSTAEGCQQLFEGVQALGQHVDILVNNAGIAQFGRFDEVPAEKWELLVQINLLAPMRLSHLFIPGMIERRRGHIVNISSLAGWIGSRGLTSYTASKFGLRGFGEALSDELKPHNVQVTNAYPFFSRTPILDSPSYGTLERAPQSERMFTEPEEVIQQVIKGIRNNQLHVFPDRMAKIAHLIRRFIPRALPYITNRKG